MNYLGGFTITVYRLGASTQGPYGNVPGAWAADHTIAGCLVQSLKGKFASAETQTAATDLISSHYLLHLPAGSDILATDQVTASGLPQRFMVAGDPGVEPNFDGSIDHIEVELEVISG